MLIGVVEMLTHVVLCKAVWVLRCAMLMACRRGRWPTWPMADDEGYSLCHTAIYKHQKSKAAGRARRETPDGGVTRVVCVCVCAPWLCEVVHPVCGYRNLFTEHSGMVPLYSPPAHRTYT